MRARLFLLTFYVISVAGTSNGQHAGHTYSRGDVVFVSVQQSAMPVTKELTALLEFYRGVGLHASEDAAGGRRVLERLLQSDQLKAVQENAHATVVAYASSTPALRRNYPRTPWERVVRIKMLDGEAPGLEVWTDDSLLQRAK